MSAPLEFLNRAAAERVAEDIRMICSPGAVPEEIERFIRMALVIAHDDILDESRAMIRTELETLARETIHKPNDPIRVHTLATLALDQARQVRPRVVIAPVHLADHEAVRAVIADAIGRWGQNLIGRHAQDIDVQSNDLYSYLSHELHRHMEPYYDDFIRLAIAPEYPDRIHVTWSAFINGATERPRFTLTMR